MRRNRLRNLGTYPTYSFMVRFKFVLLSVRCRSDCSGFDDDLFREIVFELFLLCFISLDICMRLLAIDFSKEVKRWWPLNPVRFSWSHDRLLIIPFGCSQKTTGPSSLRWPHTLFQKLFFAFFPTICHEYQRVCSQLWRNKSHFDFNLSKFNYCIDLAPF